jgi:7-cyano-7-deazaguanine synthase
MPDFGRHVSSGLTDKRLHIVDQAFTPCRNLIFIVLAAAIARKHGTTKIVLGLLSEETALFPDQTDSFLDQARLAINAATGEFFDIITPLREFRKSDVMQLATHIGVTTYYSCHAGTEEPCGECIACREYNGGE